MARNYTAFISYRHLPLDIAVAEAVHRQIEGFRVPKGLRKSPEQKTLGTVFRDRDELPLSNNLTQDIYEALDHAEFLIVICTPDTPKSMWVQREIEHFIQIHGRERILTVLAAGTPEEAIPKAITHRYAPDGVTVLEQTEPLCAFLVDDSPKKVVKNIGKELNRLAAAILGCPYDTLVQRRKQRQMKQLMTLLAVAMTVTLGFVGMLLSKNRQIHEQLQQTLYQQSQALTLLSESQLKEGSRLSALKNAVEALPSEENQRPYYAPAREALANALYIYQKTEHRADTMIRQDTEIEDLVLSEDGRYGLTMAEEGKINCFDLKKEQLLWSFSHNDYINSYKNAYGVKKIAFLPGSNAVFYSHNEADYVLSAETGEVLVMLEYGDFDHGFLDVSPDGRQVAAWASSPTQGEFLLLMSTENEEDIYLLGIENLSVSDSAGAYSPDGTTFAFAVNWTQGKYECVEEFVFDVQTQKLLGQSLLSEWESSADASKLTVTPLDNGDFVIGYLYVSQYHCFRIAGDGQIQASGEMEASYKSREDVEVVAVKGDQVYYLYDDMIYSLNSRDCTMTMKYELPEDRTYQGKDAQGHILLQEGDHVIHRYTFLGGEELESYYREVVGAHGALILEDEEMVCVSSETFEAALEKLYFPEENAEVFALIGQEDLSAARIMRRMGDDRGQTIPLRFPQFSGGGQIHISPSGNYVEMRYDVYGYAHLFSMEDQSVRTIQDPDYSDYLIFTADESRILSRTSQYVELSGEEMVAAPGRPEVTQQESVCAVVQPSHQIRGKAALSAVYQDGTMHWWMDGENHQSSQNPYAQNTETEKDAYKLEMQAGQNGLLLIQETSSYLNREKDTPAPLTLLDIQTGVWQQVPVPSGIMGFPMVCLGRTSKILAIADLDNMLRIYDFEKNAIVREFAMPVSSGAVEEMVFLRDDSVLLLRDSLYYLIVDLETGEELGKFYQGYLESFVPSNVQEDTRTGSLYLSSPDGSRSGLIIDMENWTLIQEVPGMVGFLPEQDGLLCNPGYGEYFVIYPIDTMEDLLAMAREQIN